MKSSPLTPIRLAEPHRGLCFDRSAGHLYRPSFVDGDGKLLQWDRSFSALIRRSALAEFLADPAYWDEGGKVIFTRMEAGCEVLSETQGLDKGAKLPRALYARLRKAEKEFQDLRLSGRLTPEEEEFLRAFRLPDVAAFPAAYRVKKAGMLSRRRLYVLWGLVPEPARAIPTIKIGGQAAAGSGFGETQGMPDDGRSPGLADDSQEQIAYDDSLGWPKWLEWLLFLLGIALVLFCLWVLLSLLSPGCEVATKDEVHLRVPPSSEAQRRELEGKIVELKKDDPDGRRLYALEHALAARKKAEAEKQAADAARRAAGEAERNAAASGKPDDAAQADRLRKEADAKAAAAKVDDEAADQAYLRPEETLRSDQLAQSERLKDLSRQAAEAEKKAKDSGSAEDVAKVESIRRETEAVRRSLPEPPLSPEAEREARNRLYVKPKASSQDGEVIVRRFKADELVPKKGIKLHLEAAANGRKDFKVLGWAFGLTPMIETERLEGFVPVGPGLSIETPLDLYFEYRGADGQMHEDCAPFVISGEIEFRLSLEIEHAKEAPPEQPIRKEVPGA